MLSHSKSKLNQFPSFESLRQWTQIHAQIIVTGSILPSSATTNLLSFLADPVSGDLSYALSVFNQIHEPSTILWNTLIRAFSRNQVPQESILFYRRMHRKGVLPDDYTFQLVFKACAQASAIREGQIIQGNFIKLFPESDIFVENSLIHMYSEFGLIEISKRVFDGMGTRNVFSWTSVVSGFAKLGLMDDACQLFDEMPERNVVSWTSMIAGFAQNGRAEEAVGFFRSMVADDIKPDAVAFLSVLSACAQLRDLDLGKWVHQFVERERICVSNNLAVALIDMYVKCGDINAARQLFDRRARNILAAWNAIIDGYSKLGELEIAFSLFNKMPTRDIVSFNSMITGYIQNNNFKEALLLFQMLKSSNLKADKFTVVGLLMACANLGALDQGKLIHAYIEESSIKPDVFVGTALLDMYSKCGRIDQAILVFNLMPQKDVLAWTAVISGLAMHGNGKSALTHFSQMQKEGIIPNRITYIGVLNACSHSGLIDDGYFHFDQMSSVYRIEHEIEHYGCMVDLLGRAGYLKEAEGFIQKMPMKPNAVIWGSLLGSCRVYNDVDLAEKAAKHLLILEPHIDATYILLYNIYARLGRWIDATEIRRVMEDRGVKKIAGFSSIMVDGFVHEFVAGDRSHPQFKEIQVMIREIAEKLKLVGYVPGTSQVLLDIDEEEKECALFNHSEKMAIAFGIIKLGPNLPIHVMKNLRVCEDCHSAIKLIAKIWQREIVVRDRSRFHHFRDGLCSCNDFW